jgi:hypothetical protein
VAEVALINVKAVGEFSRYDAGEVYHKENTGFFSLEGS